MFRRLDLHGCTVAEAKKLLDRELAAAPKGCELTVIHGFHGGTALQNFVRTYQHKRIRQKLLSLNGGETILLLN